MSDLGLLANGSWIGILSIILLICGIYFTFTFFEYLKDGEQRLRKQAKFAAIICIAAALLVPAFHQLYLYNEMMR
ncbi:hypothetical protein [Planococcus beigongshangi]|uniref:hypothetical protein n=1 Tax=Planococcus beigongshangi TaxID=2782536 RepID=UPI00193B76C4|nr:hypothetical protein [Planococcus beigongshangi]